MKHLLLFSLLSFTLPAYAEDHVLNQLWAAMLATNLQKIEKPQDFTEKLPLTDKDRALIEREIKMGKMRNFSRPKISMPTDTKVVISQGTQTVEMDFMDFHLGYVYFNRTKIALNPQTDFIQMHKMVQQALARKTSALDLVLPKAYGVDPDPNLTYMDAAAIAASNRVHDMMFLDPSAKGFDIEQSLSSVYEQMGQDAKERAKAKNKPVSLSTMRFKCQGKVATDVYDGTIVRGTTVTDPKDSDFQVHANQSRTRYNFQSTTCKSAWFDKKTIDFKSREEDTPDACPNEKTIKDTSMLKFIKLADMCCKKNGCEKNVQQKLASVTDDLTGKTAPAAPVSTDGSPGTAREGEKP